MSRRPIYYTYAINEETAESAITAMNNIIGEVDRLRLDIEQVIPLPKGAIYIVARDNRKKKKTAEVAHLQTSINRLAADVPA